MKRAAAVAMLMMSGCSLLFVKGPGSWSPENKRAPVCDIEARVPVIGDVAIGLIGIVPLGVAIDGTDSTDGDRSLGDAERVVAGTLGVAMIIGSIVSIATGLDRARSCRAATADYLMSPR